MPYLLTCEKNDFTITGDEDEIRVDGLCRELLREFHGDLLEQGVDPLEAGSMAHGADYYVRDFMVSAQRLNLFEEQPGAVRRFAATWYIISNLEPGIDEIAGHLKGVREFYRFLHRRKLITSSFLERVEEECADTAYYESRIASFWNMEAGGYQAWEAECSLKR
jgi:hypothetical protein